MQRQLGRMTSHWPFASVRCLTFSHLFPVMKNYQINVYKPKDRRAKLSSKTFWLFISHIHLVSKCACILCCRCSWFTCMLHHLESSFTSCYASSMGSRLKTTSMKTTSAFQLEMTEALTSLPRRHRFRFGRQRTTRRLWISRRRTPTLSRFPWQQSATRVTLNSLPPEG